MQRIDQLAALLAGVLFLIVLWIALPAERETPAAPHSQRENGQPTQPPGLRATALALDALDRRGLLLFECKDALCLMSASGAEVARIAPPTTGGRLAMPRWSPTGDTFAAIHLPSAALSRQPAATPQAAAATAGSAELRLYSADGKELAAFAPGEGFLPDRSAQLVWSPTGGHLALQARAAGAQGEQAAQIWLLAHDNAGHAIAEVAVLPSAAESRPSWSADGRWLAYVRASTSDGREAVEELWVYDTAQRDQDVVAEGRHPDWAAGQERLVFVAADGSELRTVAIKDGRQQVLLTLPTIEGHLAASEPWLPEARFSFAWPVWSPAGTTLAFRLWGEPTQTWSRYIPGMLFTIAADGSDLRRWPDTDMPSTALQLWSPGGEQLIYPYWLIGQERFNPLDSTAEPAQRYTYRCTVGLVLVDLRLNSYREEACGTTAVAGQGYGSWSPSGRSFATRAGLDIAIISVGALPQRRHFSALQPNDLQWQPQPAQQ